MGVTVYEHSDPDAPVLNGAVGSLSSLLRACLVVGYGTKPAAGWTEAFTGTNTVTLRQGSGNLYYLHVNDNGPGLGVGKEARVFGSETATAVLTGLNLLPTAAQQANGCFWRKSTSADAIVRPWILIGDEQTFYLWVLTGDIVGTYIVGGFGGFYSFKTNDLGRTFIVGRPSENTGSTGDTLDLLGVVGTVHASFWLMRDTQNNVGAITASKIGDQSFLTAPGNGNVMAGSLAYKNPSDNRIYLAPLRIGQVVGGVQFRGRMRGLWHFGHAVTNVSDGDTLSGVDTLESKIFRIIKVGQNNGIFCVETSDTWENNDG